MAKASHKLLLCLLLSALPSRALIFLGSGDPEKNTTAPTGALAGSGWEFQGKWGIFTGTPIGPHHFLAAKHVGGAVGDIFSWNGTNYTTISATADPVADLRIWEIRETFPSFAQLYNGPVETNKTLVVFGRGGIRGGEVRLMDELRGWAWAALDGRLRWGTNVVTAVIKENGQPQTDPPYYMQVDFNAEGGADETHLAAGDSSGGVFIQQDGEWRLAGINWAVDGPYSFTSAGPSFNAALFKHDGFYVWTGVDWLLITPETPVGSFYSTRVKTRLPWIQSVLARQARPVVLEASDPTGPFALASDFEVDPATRIIRIPLAGENRFYELQAAGSLQINSSKIESNALVIEYSSTLAGQ